MGESKSFIDLVLTDQPYLFLESGVHPALDELRHHHIIYGKIIVANVAPPPYRRRIWFYDRANILAIRRSINMFNWHETLGQIGCPDQQVKCLNEILLNIFSNFIPCYMLITTTVLSCFRYLFIYLFIHLFIYQSYHFLSFLCYTSTSKGTIMEIRSA